MASQLSQRLRESTTAARAEEPPGFKDLRLGRLAHRPGVNGRYFPALDIAHGMLRDFALYTVYPTLALHRGVTDVGITRQVARRMFPTVANYLGYSGFTELRQLTGDLLTELDASDHPLADELLANYLGYVNALYAWAFHYFPWSIGDNLQYAEPQETESPPPVTADTLEPTDSLIRLRWEPLGVEVRAFLAIHHNEELCNELLAAMPFRALQTHSMVAGESLMAWTPLTSTSNTPFREEIRLAPVGRLRFNANTGQKLIVQYGRTSEDILAPVIGSVFGDDIHLLQGVGAAIWRSTYETKEPIWLHVERVLTKKDLHSAPRPGR